LSPVEVAEWRSRSPGALSLPPQVSRGVRAVAQSVARCLFLLHFYNRNGEFEDSFRVALQLLWGWAVK
jgi:hypothetical protein